MNRLRAARAVLLSLLGWLEHHAILFVAVGLVGLFVLGYEVHNQQVSQGTLRVSQLRACHRQNIKTARDNRNWLQQYHTDRRTLDYDRTFQTLVLLSLKHPTARPTAEGKRNTALFLGKLEGEIVGIESSVANIEWTPLTPCAEATDYPTTYAVPGSVPFALSGIRESKGVLLLPLALQQALYVGVGE